MSTPAAPLEKPTGHDDILKPPPQVEGGNFTDLDKRLEQAVKADDSAAVVEGESATDFLRRQEGIEPTAKAKSENPAPADPPVDNLDDLSKIVETPTVDPAATAIPESGKKSKEDNIAELRKARDEALAQVQAVQKERDEAIQRSVKFEEELEKAAFEKSPKFREKYQEPYNRAVDTAKATAKDLGVDESVAERALALRGKDRVAYIDEQLGGGAAAAALLNSCLDADRNRGALDAALGDYKAKAVEMAQEAKVEEARFFGKVTDDLTALFERAGKSLSCFRKTGDPENDKAVDARIQQATAIYLDKAPESEKALVPMFAVVAKDALARAVKAEAELAKYKARAASSAAAEPGIAGNRAESSTPANSGTPKGAKQAIHEALRNMGV
jgi:hypothetical protein